MSRYGPFGKFEGEIPFKIGDLVIRPDGYVVPITRIDSHVYPVCAGGYRYKPQDLKLAKER